MTSTSFNVGLTEGNRLSSRVLRPPGGGHTDIFGGEPEAPRGRRAAPSVVAAAAAAAATAAALGQVEEAVPTNGTEAPSHNGQETHEPPQPAPEPAPAPAQAQEQEPKPESPKTESVKAEAPIVEVPKAEAPKRVRVPPGGFSSGLW